MNLNKFSIQILMINKLRKYIMFLMNIKTKIYQQNHFINIFIRQIINPKK